MTVNLNADGYEMLRERKPLIECYAELQTEDGTAVCARYALASYRTSAANVTPMTFSLPISGADITVTLPCLIQQARIYETETGDTPISPPDTVAPLLLALPGDAGATVLTVTLPKVV